MKTNRQKLFKTYYYLAKKLAVLTILKKDKNQQTKLKIANLNAGPLGACSYILTTILLNTYVSLSISFNALMFAGSCLPCMPATISSDCPLTTLSTVISLCIIPQGDKLQLVQVSSLGQRRSFAKNSLPQLSGKTASIST